MTMEDFGAGVSKVWNDLRSTTRSLLERAWQSPGAGAAVQTSRATHYDPRADRELIRLLAALDAGVARDALQRQVIEYNSKEAQQALQDFEEFGFEEF